MLRFLMIAEYCLISSMSLKCVGNIRECSSHNEDTFSNQHDDKLYMSAGGLDFIHNCHSYDPLHSILRECYVDSGEEMCYFLS